MSVKNEDDINDLSDNADLSDDTDWDKIILKAENYGFILGKCYAFMVDFINKFENSLDSEVKAKVKESKELVSRMNRERKK